jgi:ketosteroid isomerase-like protein
LRGYPVVVEDYLARIEPAKTIIKAFGERDIDLLVDQMTEDAVLQTSAFVTGVGEYRGTDELRAGFADFVRQFEESGEQVRIKIARYYVDAQDDPDDAKVLGLGTVTIVPAAGDDYDTPVAYLWTVTGGKVSRLETWLDHVQGLDRLREPVLTEAAG